MFSDMNVLASLFLRTVIWVKDLILDKERIWVQFSCLALALVTPGTSGRGASH